MCPWQRHCVHSTDCAGCEAGEAVDLTAPRERSRMDTAEMEKAAGRMGAADKRVVYDHAAIERLLDRYDLGFEI